MAIERDEALACLRVLAAVARADGTIQSDERKSLAAAIESLELPEGASVDALVAEDVDVDAALAAITSAEAREQVYRSATFMAYADGGATPEERELVARIGAAVGATEEETAALRRLFPDHGSDKPLLRGFGRDAGARVAVSGIASLVPGWYGAGRPSLAPTNALGSLFKRLFARGKPADEAAREGDALKEKIEALTAELESGAISQEEFDRRVAALT